ncbi:hypothetical protein PILCRDRAFT_813172 [Piloderma croceum F 1598]|uniref:Uncharacterized protein n=1 Tax=Piloderma croceum (strain F 1598) TaxID=765440 RepID=A0A0C3GBW9_PILCF|nr:hypothetical protein PILCRDRAFT_813172 [Piloderma croceum F 1598]
MSKDKEIQVVRKPFMLLQSYDTKISLLHAFVVKDSVQENCTLTCYQSIIILIQIKNKLTLRVRRTI